MDKPRMVLLHGVGLDHTMWEPAAALLRADFEVVTPDLLGHGANAPADRHVDLAALAADVVPHLRPGTHLVGFSLGALVAQHLARHHGERIACLVSVSSVCRRTDQERAAVLERLATASSDFPTSVAASLRRWYAETDVPRATVEQTERTLLANDVASYLACYRVFATADAEIGPELPRIAVPSLAVTGELDPGSTPDMTRRLADAVPGGRAVIVAGARHMLPVQMPHQFVDALKSFVVEATHV
jgi:(E)-2-((N-methylformamido)methylene)succinate hydrolase